MSTDINNYKFDLEGLNLDDLDVQELEQRLELAAGSGGHNQDCNSCHDQPKPSDDGGIY
jgi:hypothetical protein